MGKIIKKENWSDVSRKLKHLSHFIQSSAGRISSQAERQRNVISAAIPARTIETASIVTIVSPLPFQAKLPSIQVPLNMKLQDVDVYVPLDVNPYMEGFEYWQRFVLVNTHVVIVAWIINLSLCSRRSCSCSAASSSKPCRSRREQSLSASDRVFE
jgi:hypothetical protein